ncbi:hypothetical protein SAMN05192583_2934 [Sphingomonas gellani]|uniref:HEPN domain-containing protein n=1 Tax=Sphingomonas gellani TaxID=1166340 RepID=A0A1H8H5G9_9SPHN|nr:hypothetical protein [Sphingomonas gellani]SEN51269.1 hypothetical protein SAMN05192583_2934 [Sphingomonas gellani]
MATPNAATLFMGAWAYANAMELLIDDMDQPGRHHLGAPYALLNGFALELGFKAALLAAGGTERVNRDIGHDLSLCLAEAAKAGVRAASDPSVRRVIELMRIPHLQHQMRYVPARVEKILLPEPAFALATLKGLIDAIWVQFPRIADEMPH